MDEFLIIDPLARAVELLSRLGDRYEPIARGSLIELDARELAEQIAWPEEGVTR